MSGTAGEVTRAVEAVRRLRDGRHLLLLLDFDGTLCEFEADPGAVTLPDARRRILMGISRSLDRPTPRSPS